MSERGGETGGGLRFPESLAKGQNIDNLRAKEPDDMAEWREVEYGGVNGKIISRLVEVEGEEGVKTKLRLLVADFRKEDDSKLNVVVNCCGFPGLNEDVRREFLHGEFDRSFSKSSLDIDGIARAARERGILYIPDLFILPIDRKKRKQSFKTDANVIAAGIWKVRGNLNKAAKVTLIGISNGAGEAGALAAQLSKENQASKILLRMYSLIGVVPVPDMVSAFGKEIWSIAMQEVADRYEEEYKVPHDVTNVEGQKGLLRDLLAVLRTKVGREKFINQVKASLRGGQEGGNLQVGIDMIKKIMKDVRGILPHLGKFENPDYLAEIGPNVEVELVVPKYDGVFRDRLQAVIMAGAETAGCADEAKDLVEDVMGGLFAVSPGKWLRRILPGASEIRMAVLGESLTDPLARHTGPLIGAGDFIDAVGEKI